MRGTVALALIFGCSGAAPVPDIGVPAPVADVEPEPEPVLFPGGSFAIERAREVTDHCGNMVWGSKTIEIDPVTKTLYSSPDDRLYDTFIDRGALVARGMFEPRAACPNHTYVELWRLEKRGDDRLSGYVTTYSHFNAADCLHACKAVFEVDAVRAPPAE